MVKTLVDTRRQNRNANVRFVVWGNSYADINSQPKYSWSLNFRRNKKPIICSIDYEWTVGIIQDKKLFTQELLNAFLTLFQ